MASLIPAFHTAMRDPALRGHPREVYVWLHEQLDVVEYRAVKHLALAEALAMKKQRVFDALTLLQSAGYLVRGERIDRLWTYRLVYSRPSEVPKPDHKSA